MTSFWRSTISCARRGFTVMTTEEALDVASKIGYPVLMRPSYVLGGQNMIIAYNDDDIVEYMSIILSQNIENPVLIDKYLMGTELEVDAICDGEDILIPGIMEHIERAGVHSGDSIAVYPAWNINDEMTQKIIKSSRDLALSLDTKGLVNIQYLIYNDDLYVIEVNPRSSRTIPYISKVTGVPMVDLATRAMLGEKLKDMGYGTGLFKKSPYIAVKVPVFSFEKLINVDNHLGPEMKSTGEVLGIAETLEEALYKGLVGAGYKMTKSGGVLITVRNSDKGEIGDVAKKYAELGFKIYATKGTADVLKEYGIDAEVVGKIHESADNTLTLIESGKVSYVISTSSKGPYPNARQCENPQEDGRAQYTVPYFHRYGERPCGLPAQQVLHAQHGTCRHQPHEKRKDEVRVHEDAGLRQRLHLFQLPEKYHHQPGGPECAPFRQALRYWRRRHYFNLPV